MVAQVTLGHEPVEWIDPFEELRPAIWDDAAFEAYVADRGVGAALITVSHLHRVVANQLIGAAVSDPLSSPWAKKTIFLCVRLKRRRNVLRARFRDLYGADALAVEVARIQEKWPRAVWGAAPRPERRGT